MSNRNFKKGVSIIIPCARPNEHLSNLLDSIYRQRELSKDFLEVILIFNGHTEFIIDRFADKLNKLKTKHKVRLFYSSVGSASKARNIGLEVSTKDLICFCDDDDWIGVNYISELYKIANTSNIAFAPIIDVSMDGQRDLREDINEFLKSNGPNDLPLYSRALTLNACKLIPAIYAKEIRFDENLMSGEDVVYFCEYLNRFLPRFVHTNHNDCCYYRLKTENSTSRQPVSYDFNVEQRLDVIKKLVVLNSDTLNNFIQSKVNAQLSFLNNYFSQNPNTINSIQESFKSRDLSDLVVIRNGKFYINLS